MLLHVWLLSLLASVASQRKLSTWVKPGTGGPMGDDLTEALAWVRVKTYHLSRLIIGVYVLLS